MKLNMFLNEKTVLFILFFTIYFIVNYIYPPIGFGFSLDGYRALTILWTVLIIFVIDFILFVLIRKLNINKKLMNFFIKMNKAYSSLFVGFFLSTSMFLINIYQSDIKGVESSWVHNPLALLWSTFTLFIFFIALPIAGFKFNRYIGSLATENKIFREVPVISAKELKHRGLNKIRNILRNTHNVIIKTDTKQNYVVVTLEYFNELKMYELHSSSVKTNKNPNVELPSDIK
ncbi:MAG: hypothetical protein LW807_02620 [Proteobacteria bacterium]|jgi:hypothetical protein|nr:hypothetical protein [Pseudomonadota bacterium]